MFPMTKFNVLNFRRQSAPKLTTSQRLNKRTNKQETFHDIQNDAGYSFKMVTPPCNALFPHLNEGGNFGGKFSQTKEVAKITTNLVRDGSDTAFKSEREDYFDYMSKFNDNCLEQMYNSDIGGSATAIRAKNEKRYGKKKTKEELEAMSLKAYKKNAMVPLKSRDGDLQLTVKCKAYNNDLSPRDIRYVQPVGDKYVTMEESPEIRNGALLSIPFTVRPFAMSKDKYGLTYTMIPDIIVYSTGNGRQSATMEMIETPCRPYTFKVAEGKEGKVYLNILDNESIPMEMRTVASEVVFSDLTGTGTLGRISGVTESTAKYSAVTKEDIENPESVAFFDYIEKMQNDILDYAINNEKLLIKLKDDSKEDATDMSTETGESYESCFRIVIMDAFNPVISKRDEDKYRQLRFSQNVYNKNGSQNQLLWSFSDPSLTADDIRRGSVIAPVLRPSIYFMPDGKFGLKLGISLNHNIRLDSNPESSGNNASGVLYNLDRLKDERPAKRVKTEL